MSKRKSSKPSKYCHLCGPTEHIVFSFLKQNPDRMKKWLEFCNLTQLDVLQVPYLCNEHFEDKFILKKQQKTLLHGYAIPTIIVQHSVNLLNTEEPLKKKRARNCYLCGPTVLHLHQFPKDDVRRSEWFKALNISVDKCEDLKLCSNHFSSDSSLITPNGKIKLKPNARPDKMIQMLNNEQMNTDSETVLNMPPLNPISLEKVRKTLEELASTSKSDDNRFTKIVQTDRGTGCNAFNDNDAAVFLDISGVSGTSVEENTALSVGTEEQPSEYNPKYLMGIRMIPLRSLITGNLNVLISKLDDWKIVNQKK